MFRQIAVPLRRDLKSHRENRRRLSNSSELDCVRLALSLHPDYKYEHLKRKNYE